MKTLVLYDSRHGFTERCLALLQQEVPGVELWSVRREGTPPWAEYQAVVFGGPVYLGRWAPRLVRFLNAHSNILETKEKVGGFVVSLSPRAAALDYFRRGLPGPLAEKTGHVACFGGGIVWRQLSWWEQTMVRIFRGIQTDASNLDLGEIQGLAAWLTANPGSAKAPQP